MEKISREFGLEWIVGYELYYKFMMVKEEFVVLKFLKLGLVFKIFDGVEFV